MFSAEQSPSPEPSSTPHGGQAFIAPQSPWAPDEAFRVLVENMRDYAMFLISLDGRIRSWSLGVEHVLAYGEEEFLQLSVEDLFVPEDRALGAPAAEMQRAALMGRTEDERWHLRGDGTRLWVSGVLTALRDENGELRGYAKVMRDNTAQYLLQQEREVLLDRERAARLAAEELRIQAEAARQCAEEARRAAEDADKAKDRFIAVVTHELRTPLSVILGWASVLRENTLEVEQHRRGVETLERNAHALARLVEDLLDTARIREGRIQLDMEEVELGALAAQVLEEFRPVAREQGIQCHADTDCIALVRGDAGRLRQIIANLLSNSMKFTPQGGDIWVTLAREPNNAVLTVRDSGQGIAPEFLPHVFDSFQQQQLAQAGGLGLGLAIVSSLVEQHGGTVRADSAGVGQGAAFVVQLPLSQAATAS